MTPEEHRNRHIELHRALDELMADFQRHTGRMFSVTNILELATWSHAQAIEPDPGAHDSRLDAPEHFELGIDYACYRPTGNVNFERMIDLCSAAISFAQTRNISRLLVDTRGLTGFGVPSMLDRFEFAQRVSTAPKGSMKVVFLVAPEMIDPNYFGLDVAHNRGFDTAIFASEPEAVTWLLDPNK